MSDKATPRPWRVRVDEMIPDEPRLVIEGDCHPANEFLSYVVCADDMPMRREQAIVDYELIVRSVNSAPIAEALHAALKRIVTELPTNRDWLDPELERFRPRCYC